MVSSAPTAEVCLGAFRGSISYSKFHVRGAQPEGADESPAAQAERFVEAIRMRAFRELDPLEEIDHRVGWCSIENPFDLDLQHEKIFFNGYVNLGLRVDTWRIPGSLFKASFREAERAFLAKQGSEKLTRSQKKNLEAMVTRTLRQKVVPAMNVVDLSWSLGDGVVRFFHPSPKRHEVLIELFEKTFELQLAHDGAYLAAEKRGLDEALLASLPLLDPMTLVGGTA